MLETKLNKKGMVLLFVLATFLIVACLAAVIISIISMNARIVYHQTSRIQAYYAALAGMNVAIEKVRIGESGWVPDTGTISKTLCGSGCDVYDYDIPYTVTMTIYSPNSGPDGVGRKITVNVTYPYTS